MLRKIWAKPGSSRDLYCGSETKTTEKQWKRIICREMLCRFFARPLSLLLGGVFWFHLYSLCQFGKIKKNNWGDDLNVHLFKMITPQKIQFIPFNRKSVV